MLTVLHSVSWREILRNNFIRWEQLADFLELSEVQRKQISTKPKFILNLPYRLAEKIEKGTLNDPLLRQFLPTISEEDQTEGYQKDPVGDSVCRRSSKLLHKYQGRALLVCTSACAMHCRYCFRQHFDYEAKDKSFEDELEVIRRDSTIHEVILSGGDPLSLTNHFLRSLIERLSEIPHIKRVRFHSRFVIGIPERIDEEFLQIIKDVPLQFWFVIHCNHPRELDSEIFQRLSFLQQLGVPVLNQAVLLRGVNDDLETLKELCETLIDRGISPYYLHQLDRVQGAAHFEVPEEKGKRLVQELMSVLPGYGVPTYVREVSGRPSKTIL